MLISCVWLFESPRTVAHQAPLSMESSKQEYWNGLPFPSPGESSWPRDRTQVSHIAGRFFTIWATREANAIEKNKTSQGKWKQGLPFYRTVRQGSSIRRHLNRELKELGTGRRDIIKNFLIPWNNLLYKIILDVIPFTLEERKTLRMPTLC